MSERRGPNWSNYAVAVGSTLPTLCEEVNELLKIGYGLAGDLVVVPHVDEQGDYSMFYQPMIKHVGD